MTSVPWCYPDECPASICGGPHTAILIGDATIIAPPTATAAEIEQALDYARHMYGEPEEP
jgi:hypothetical protein